MLADVISRHPQVASFAWSRDAELDAALLLSGTVRAPEAMAATRPCFQSTYLNECYLEYLAHAGSFSLVWLVRNPHSVVYSMLYNWRRFALNELFISCGSRHLQDTALRRYLRFGPAATRPIVRACLSYVAKAEQAVELARRLPEGAIMFLEYDTLVREPARSLRAIGDFAGLEAVEALGSGIRTDSLAKASRLSARESRLVDELCTPGYRALQELTQ